MKKSINVNQQELIALTQEVCHLGERKGYAPDEFAVMLSMIAKHLSEAQGIEITSERVLSS